MLMARLLLENFNPDAPGTNRYVDAVALSDAEASELARLLNELVGSKDFQDASFFVEGMTIPGQREVRELREIYLSGRKRGGRSRALGSIRWYEFQARLGIVKDADRRTGTEPMNFMYFLEMERRLLGLSGLHPHVIPIILKLVAAQHQSIEAVRQGHKWLPHGTIKNLVLAPFSCREEHNIPTAQLAAAITVVADISVLFTTRDWGVTGTISTIAGASIAAVRK